MQYSLVLVTYVLALLCPLLCAGYLFAADPDVVIYRHEAYVNVTGNNTDSSTVNETSNETVFCDLDTQVCTNGDALCAQGDKLVLGSDCDPTGLWAALLLLKWVYIFVWLTRLPILFTSVMHAVGKEGKVTPPHKLVDVCSVVSQLASFAAFVITVAAFSQRMQFWSRTEQVVYFPTGFPFMLWYVMRLDFGLSLLLPLWFNICDYSRVAFPLALIELLITFFSSFASSCIGIAHTMAMVGTHPIMPYYMPFVVLTALAYPAWVCSIHSSYLGGLVELLTVCSFFVYTASYYALGVEDREDTTYFMYGLHRLQMMAPICLFWVALSTTPVRETVPQKHIYKPISWEGVCAMPEQQAAAVARVLSAIDTAIAARSRKNGTDSRTPEALPQDTLHTAFHGATVAKMSRIVEYFCGTQNGFAIIVASRVLIDRNDLLVDMDIPASLKYRLLKACDDEALSTHVLDKIPIAELCKSINDVERNPDEALDYVENFVCVEKLIPECKGPFVAIHAAVRGECAHTAVRSSCTWIQGSASEEEALHSSCCDVGVCVSGGSFVFDLRLCDTWVGGGHGRKHAAVPCVPCAGRCAGLARRGVTIPSPRAVHTTNKTCCKQPSFCEGERVEPRLHFVAAPELPSNS